MKIKNHTHWFDTWVVVIFILSAILQICLGSVNTQANDDHIEVSVRITESSAVERESCVQCYHPHLFHGTVALIGEFMDKTDYNTLNQIGQIINVLAGIALLVVVWMFISSLEISLLTKRLAFALVAFNPELISSNIQAANNTFVILFSSIALLSLYKLFKTNKDYYFLLVLASTILAALSKASGIVLFIGISISFLIFIILNRKNYEQIKKYISYLLLFVIIFSVAASYWGPYYKYYKKYSNPFAGNWIEEPRPDFFQKTYLGRPGITSVVDGYFTFRFINLVKDSDIVANFDGYTLPRTSFWTILFARTFSIHYPLWPSTWVDQSMQVKVITRSIYILALVPTALFLIGLFISIRKIIQGFLKEKSHYLKNNPEWMFLIFTSIFVLALMDFSAHVRDFATIKTLYIYPALLSFIYYFIVGNEYLVDSIKEKKYRKQVILFWFVFLGLTVYDLFLLLLKLA